MNRRSSDHQSASALWLYGIHPVRAALENPRRKRHRVLLTDRAAAIVGQRSLAKTEHHIVSSDVLARVVPPGAVHQGAALLCEPLPRLDLADLLLAPSRGPRTFTVLDQISDPHNVGAILRSAVAFGVSAVVVQDRHAAAPNGALAKAASGALDIVPYVEVVNIARALEQFGAAGVWRLALSGDGEQSIRDSVPEGDVVLVLGSEGSGLRRLVRERCDAAVFIPMASAMESLNVSVAAAIAFYEINERAVLRNPPADSTL
jgi:23S rRNA (guanosine2251-2'-O)-methyltransferase